MFFTRSRKTVKGEQPVGHVDPGHRNPTEPLSHFPGAGNRIAARNATASAGFAEALRGLEQVNRAAPAAPTAAQARLAELRSAMPTPGRPGVGGQSGAQQPRIRATATRLDGR